jgi:hypothetical protein
VIVVTIICMTFRGVASALVSCGMLLGVACSSTNDAAPAVGGSAATSDDLSRASGRVTFAFISDTPTGQRAVEWFPLLVEQVDADPDVSFVAHGGDIRGGDVDCSDASLRLVFDLVQTFDDPFWYVPGDNEWADCHRNGGFLPTERLDAIRSTFFPDPSRTIGGVPMSVDSQSSTATGTAARFVEHTRFSRECVMFGAIHVAGSGDDAEPWGQYPGDPAAGLAPGDQPELRLGERAERRAAALAWLDDLFAAATSSRAGAVVVMMHAEPVDEPAFADVRTALFNHARAFRGEVLLLHGDSHTYRDTPLYGGLSNLTRLEAPGDEGALNRWLKVTGDCGVGATRVFSHELLFFDVPIGADG